MTPRPLHTALPAGQAHSLAAHGQAVLRVIAGRVWATRSGDPQDHVVAPGQWLPLDGARWVVESLDGRPAAYELLLPAARRAGSLAPDRDALGQVHPQREDRRGRQQAAGHAGAPVAA